MKSLQDFLLLLSFPAALVSTEVRPGYFPQFFHFNKDYTMARRYRSALSSQFTQNYLNEILSQQLHSTASQLHRSTLLYSLKMKVLSALVSQAVLGLLLASSSSSVTAAEDSTLPVCKPTSYSCPANKDGDASFCSEWVADSVCHSGLCYTPKNCDSTDISAPEEDSMASLNSKMAQLEKLLERAAEASGKKSTDIVPTNVKNLVAEMNEDEGEAFLGDMTIDDVLHVMHAVGHDDSEKKLERVIFVYLDDALNYVAGRSGKVRANVILRGKTLSVWACLDAGNKVPNDRRLATSSTWNEKKRMSTSYIDSDDGAFCLQSDLQLTKYGKANAQLVKAHIDVFAVSIGVYHAEVARVL
jgi:hypothetical protein